VATHEDVEANHATGYESGADRDPNDYREPGRGQAR